LTASEAYHIINSDSINIIFYCDINQYGDFMKKLIMTALMSIGALTPALPSKGFIGLFLALGESIVESQRQAEIAQRKAEYNKMHQKLGVGAFVSGLCASSVLSGYISSQWRKKLEPQQGDQSSLMYKLFYHSGKLIIPPAISTLITAGLYSITCKSDYDHQILLAIGLGSYISTAIGSYLGHQVAK
jgi:hypothetical protein